MLTKEHMISVCLITGGGNFDCLMDWEFYSLSCCLVIKSGPTLCNPVDCSMPGFPVFHYLLEFTQTHVHWISHAIQPSHPLLSPSSPPSIIPSIRIFSNELALHIRWPKYWDFSISLSNEHSGFISFRINWLDLLVVQGTLKSLAVQGIFKSLPAP